MADLVQVSYDKPDLPVVGTALSAAQLIEIDDQVTYELADARLVEVKASYKRIDAQRKAIVDPINKAKQAVQDLFNPVLDDLSAAEGHIKAIMLTYQREQDRKRQEEQARNDEAARKERERLEKQAAKAEEKGHAEKAAVLAATAAVVAPAVATSTYVQPKGVSTRKVWKGRVTNIEALLASLVKNPAFIARLVTIAEGDLNKLAVALEGQIPLDGIECYQEETLARRAA